MGSALANNDTLDQRTANLTGLARTAIDTKIILKAATAVDPVDAGTVMIDAGL
jgi:hypothetical protein